jgi:hypothetical protein
MQVQRSCVVCRYLSLVDHERTGHPEAYLCILCGLACGSADRLISHSHQLHPRTTTYICRSLIRQPCRLGQDSFYLCS